MQNLFQLYNFLREYISYILTYMLHMGHSTVDLAPKFFLRLIFFSFFVEKYLILIFLFQYDMHNFREIYFWKLLISKKWLS